MLTFLELEEIEEIEKGMHIPNSAQKRLAEEVTRFIHGEAGLEAAHRVTQGLAPGSQATLSFEALKELSSDMPHASLKRSEIIGQRFVDVALSVGLVPSKSEAVRLIQNGGAYFNNKKISEPSFSFTSNDLIGDSYLLLSAGKKKRILIQVLAEEKN